MVRADPNNFWGGVNRCARAGVSNPYSDSITTETPRASEVMKSDSGNDFVRGPITALAVASKYWMRMRTVELGSGSENQARPRAHARSVRARPDTLKL